LSTRLWFTLVGLLAMGAGTALWLLRAPTGMPAPRIESAPRIAPVALYAAAFTDLQGRQQALGQFQGKLVVVNFWATWCAPCREEMPAFDRLYARWRERGVEIVGISAEEGAAVARFASSLNLRYPLWIGGGEVGELSRRLGNSRGVLPHTVLISPTGQVLETRVGPYTEEQLEARLSALAAKKR
jgi:thiol-disulfide isomerase/thioredoxin